MLRYHFTPTGMVKMKKTTIKSVDKNMGKWGPHALSGERKGGQQLWETVLATVKRLSIELQLTKTHIHTRT